MFHFVAQIESRIKCCPKINCLRNIGVYLLFVSREDLAETRIHNSYYLLLLIIIIRNRTWFENWGSSSQCRVKIKKNSLPRLVSSSVSYNWGVPRKNKIWLLSVNDWLTFPSRVIFVIVDVRMSSASDFVTVKCLILYDSHVTFRLHLLTFCFNIIYNTWLLQIRRSTDHLFP